MEELFEIKSRFGKFPDYRVTKSGNIYSYRQGGVLKPLSSNVLDTSGYPIVIIVREDGKRVTIKIHTIVADTFIENSNILHDCINHKDENKRNNNVSNLEWCSRLYNNTYNNKAIKIGLKLRDSNPRKKAVNMIKDGVIINTFNSIREAGRYLGNAKCDANINNSIKTGKPRYGYNWEYVTI